MNPIPNEYTIRLKDANGTVLNPKIDTFSSIRYTRSVNQVGTCELVMNDAELIQDVNSWSNFKTDGRIEIWKSVDGGAQFLDGDTVYFIRKLARDLTENGTQVMTFTGEDTIGILNRRTAAIKENGKYSNISTLTAADDVLKTIWYNYLGANADVVGVAMYGATLGVGFRLDSYITQQANATAAPTITKEFKGRNILQTMQEIAQASTTAGTYLAFDIFTDGNAMEFRTYVNQRGIDRRSSTAGALLLGPDLGNVSACHFEDDHTQEATYIVNGKGTPAVSVDREGVSPFGRIMKVMSSALVSGSKKQLTSEAQAQLRYNRSKKLMIATMVQTKGCLYGVHYGYGDYVTVSTWGQQFDAHLDATDTQIADGKETVNCLFRGEYQAWL